LYSPLGFLMGTNVSATVSLLIAALITGYIFAEKIWEARREALTRITVLTAALVMMMVMFLASLPAWAPSVEEEFADMLGATPTSTSEWLGIEIMAMFSQAFMNVVGVLALGFIGLYIGSMLRKPVKSQK